MLINLYSALEDRNNYDLPSVKFFLELRSNVPLALNATKVAVKEGKYSAFLAFTFFWTGSKSDFVWILLFESWILPEEGSQPLWRLQWSEGIPTGRAIMSSWRSAHPSCSQPCYFRIAIQENNPLMRISWCGTEWCIFWDGSCKVLGLFQDLLIDIRILLVGSSALHLFHAF